MGIPFIVAKIDPHLPGLRGLQNRTIRWRLLSSQ